MLKADFFKLCAKAKGDLYVSSLSRGSKGRRDIVLHCHKGFDDTYLPRTERTVHIASRKTFEETFHKYGDWLSQWREKRNERPAKCGSSGRRVAASPRRRQGDRS